MKKVVIVCLTVFFLATSSGFAAKDAPSKLPSKKGNLVQKEPGHKLSVTHHTLKVDGQIIKYKATTGYMSMQDDSGKEKAKIFFIAYTKEGIKKPGERPVTFTFNGGPGSASLWLHMGGLGPKRVKMSDDGLHMPPPYGYEENPYSWLGFTDLVFIDPVSTGYSRPAEGESKKQFHGVKEDIASVGDFIRLYVTKNERWLSPKFLCGESYGTFRAAGLSDYLQLTHGLYLNGIVFVSTVLNFNNANYFNGTDIAYSLALPTITATSWYHKLLPPKYQADLKQTLAEVEKWALTDYISALSRGDQLEKADRQRIIEKLSQYTGFDKSYIEKVDLRPNVFNIFWDLLESKNQCVGRFDTRFTSRQSRSKNISRWTPVASNTMRGPFVAVINDYIRRELKYKNDIPYEFSTMKILPWNYGSNGEAQDMTHQLREAMHKNKHMKVRFVCGYYDAATPYFDALYTANHMGLSKDLKKNVSFAFYEAGHMPYIHKPSLIKLFEDTALFYKKSLNNQ